MAIYFAGYLSPIRNKLGNAVGRKWRTLDVLAVYNGRPRNPRTTAQQVQREHFKIMSQLSLVFAPAIELGLTVATNGTPIPPRSYFMKKNWDVVSMSDDPISGTVDATSIVCGQGNLVPAETTAAGLDTSSPLNAKVTLVDNSGTGNALATDEVYLFVYDKEAGAGILSGKKERNAEAIEIAVPASWNGHRVNGYLLTIGAAGTDNAGMVANSVMVGTGTIS